jgi:predicted small metal-binding protein
MNALELADELQIVEDKAEAHAMGHIRSTVADAKVMLRQQADRIAELESQIVALSTTYEKCMKDGFDGLESMNALYKAQEERVKTMSILFKTQADKIAELEKQLNLHKNAHHKCVEILQENQNEPIAMRYDFDGYGYKYIDSGSGSDWETRIKDAEPLYTTPQTKHEVSPLSDEEIMEISGGENLTEQVFFWGRSMVLNFARAIEAKVRGEK